MIVPKSLCFVPAILRGQPGAGQPSPHSPGVVLAFPRHTQRVPTTEEILPSLVRRGKPVAAPKQTHHNPQAVKAPQGKAGYDNRVDTHDFPRTYRFPAVHALLETTPACALAQTFSRVQVRDAVRAELTRLRAKPHGQPALNGHTPPAIWDEHGFFDAVTRALDAQNRARLQRAVNATGIVIHTNMGRAPLASAALDAVRDVAQGYSNLEMDLETGRRGGRGGQTESLLCRLAGAEAALVVNNNAAAVLLALGTFAEGGEVILSRGEMVEIGGAFRVPDVVTQNGARLVEVGTTNITRLSDYARAMTPHTKILLKVHASNFQITGFTQSVGLADLARLGRERGVLVMEDLGSGALVDLSAYGLPPEPTAAMSVASGADLVACSGDKLLGGPQCGILLGKKEQIGRMAAHPLFRALRADKMTLAALEATLRLYDSEETLRQIPVLRMLLQSGDELARRARRLRLALTKLPGITAHVRDGVGYSGGGTLPEAGLPSKVVAVSCPQFTDETLAEALRRCQPPVIGRRENGQFVMDVRTLRDDEVPLVARAFREIMAKSAQP